MTTIGETESAAAARTRSLLPVVGVDLGKKRDPTAIAVAEITYQTPPTTAESGASPTPLTHYVVRHLERIALGTPYPDVIRRLVDVNLRVAGRCGRSPVVYIDATGVGLPIVDELAAGPLKAVLWSVYFVHGERRTEMPAERKISLGKAFLVSRLQALLRDRRVHLPTTDEGRALAQELLDYEIRVGKNATDRYGAFRAGTHDDLVTAVGLAVQTDRPARPGASDSTGDP